jgi:hypothetical protein
VLSSFGSGSVRIELQLVAGHAVAMERLNARADVDGVSVDGSLVVFRFEGDEAACSELLRDLVERGIGISAFTPRASGIESVLMEIVEGGIE